MSFLFSDPGIVWLLLHYSVHCGVLPQAHLIRVLLPPRSFLSSGICQMLDKDAALCCEQLLKGAAAALCCEQLLKGAAATMRCCIRSCCRNVQLLAWLLPCAVASRCGCTAVTMQVLRHAAACSSCPKSSCWLLCCLHGRSCKIKQRAPVKYQVFALGACTLRYLPT